MPPTAEVEEVAFLLHRHDPAVEQLGRRHALTPHVIDDKQAIAGFELQGCLVLTRGRVVAHIQLVHAQLAAGNDDRAFTAQ
ncbi:hypothetical protein D9M71_650870 [compost metagenome]